MMKAIVIDHFGGPEVLENVEVNVPEILSDEVLVRNKAISINPVDVRTRAGSAMAEFLKSQLPLTLGWDISGVVEQVGDSVSDFKVGDEVFGMVRFLGHGKGYAEYVAAPAAHLALKPKTVTHLDAAAACLAALTAWQLLNNYARIGMETNLLVKAASGGVGHYAVQLAKSLGARVTGTSSLKNKDFVFRLGADVHFAHDAESMEGISDEYDVILDAFVGASIDESIRMVKPGGKIISLLPMVSDQQRNMAAAKGVEIHYELVSSSGTDMSQIAGLLGSGDLISHIYRIFPFADMKLAHLEMEKGKTVGKIALSF